MSIFVQVLFAYLIGVLPALYCDLGFGVIFFAVLLIVNLILQKYKRILLCGVALFSCVGMSLAIMPAERDNLPDRYCEVKGIVAEVPEEHQGHYSYIVDTESVKVGDREEKLHIKMRITSPEQLDTGNEAIFCGNVEKLSERDNSTDFNYNLYYRSKGITRKMHADRVYLQKARAFVPSLSFMCEYAKSRIALAIERFYDDDKGEMLKAVLIGKKSAFSPEYKRTLVKTSAIRFLHPSYLHIFLLIALCEFAFAFLGKQKREKLLIIMLVLYAVSHCNVATMLKSALLMAVIYWYRRKRGFAHYPDALAITATALLLVNPLLLFNAGFVISAVVGLLIFLFRKSVSKRLSFIQNGTVRGVVAVWLIGTFGLLPMEALYFNGVSIYGLIFTFLFLPLVVVLLMLAPITLLVYEVFGMSILFGTVCDGILMLMLNLPKMAELLPWYYIDIKTTTLTGFLIFGLLLILIKLWLDNKSRIKVFRITIVLCALICVVKSGADISRIGNMELDFVNVNQGDATVVDVFGKEKLLIDGGGNAMENSNYNMGDDVLLPYLEAKGISKIDLAVVSHYDKDHYEGVLSAIENLDVEAVLLTDTSKESKERKTITETAEENGTKVIYVTAGDKIAFNSGMEIEILSPSADNNDKNRNSIVMEISYNGRKFLFAGDADSTVEKNILGNIEDVDVFKVSHHGSKTANSQAFLEKALPELSVISVGKGNSYGHPHKESVERLESVGTKILRTDELGDIKINCDKKGNISYEGFLEVEEWQKRKAM